jgi:hypothetical protein
MIMLIGVGHWMPSFVRAAALVHALLAALNSVEPVTKGHSDAEHLAGGQGVAGSNPVVPTVDRAVSYATGYRPESSSTCGYPDLERSSMVKVSIFI